MISPDGPIVLTDMDNVAADFDAAVLERMAERNPHIPLLGVRKNFYISEDYPEHLAVVRALSDEQGFFASLEPVDGVLEGWQHMIDLGYRPRICSSPISTNPFSTTEKLGWLEQYLVPEFGQWVVDTAIITKDKAACEGIALIDDRPEVAGAATASWEHIVYDRPYNRHVPGLRQHGWLDPQLGELLETAEMLHAARSRP